jgi:hypothetical protein
LTERALGKSGMAPFYTFAAGKESGRVGRSPAPTCFFAGQIGLV